MARSRNIKPGFFTNDVLAEVEPLGRILFQGLWCHADREGRLEFRPKKLKAEVLPYDDCCIESLVSQLEARGFVLLYVVKNVQYIHVINFAKHQNPHVKEAESTIPAPCGNSSEEVREPVKHKTRTERAGLIPDSLNLIPDSISISKRASEEGFDDFWTAYPRKNNKPDALKAWKKISPSETERERIIAAIAVHKKTRQWIEDNGRYIPLPATWLNRNSWENEFSPADFEFGKKSTRPMTASEKFHAVLNQPIIKEVSNGRVIDVTPRLG